jgi:hypothetical protein
VANRLAYLREEEFCGLFERYSQLVRGLQAMINALSQSRSMR